MRLPNAGLAPIVWTIVVAGGSGLRFGGRKQFVEVAGATVVQRALDVATTVSVGVVAVLPVDALDEPLVVPADACRLEVTPGGETRAASVRAGLAIVPEDCDVVLVHDAARPTASTELFRAVVAAVIAGADAVVPAVPMTDTVRHKSQGVVDREDLLAVQTPQGFPASVLRRAHATAADATDDATLVEQAGGTVVVIEGEPANRKITDAADLVALEALLAATSGSS